MSDISERLKLLRFDKKLSQEDFAACLDSSKQVFSNYESGKRFPTYEIIVKLLEAFEVSPDWLFWGNGNMYRQKPPSNLYREDLNACSTFKNWGQRFSYLLSENEITPYRFAKLSGIPEYKINRFILDSKEPSVSDLNKIKSYFDVSIDWLLYGEIKSTQPQDMQLSASEISKLKKFLKNI